MTKTNEEYKNKWRNIKLQKLGTTYSGLAGKKKDDFNTGESKFISYMNIYLNPSLKGEALLNVRIKDGEKQNKVKYGDLFFTTSSETPDEVGISSVLLENLECDAYLNSFCFGFRLYDFNTIDPNFAKYYFRGQSFRKQMFRIAQGATRFNLSKKYFMDTKIQIPTTINEQKRIVSILETYDSYINILGEKIDIKKKINKYLRQILLTGEKRMSGFPDEWKNIKLQKLGTTYSGLTGKNKEDFNTGESKFISYMNIYLNPSLKKEALLNVKIKDGEKQNKIQYGDLFFTTSSETPDEVGISSVLLEDFGCDAYLNSFCFGFRLHDFKTIDPNFAKHYFRGQSFRKQMFRIAQGATRFNLSKKYFMDTEIHIPSSIAEQQDIASILSSADKEIEGLETKKKLVEQQRKYLLNNLITGNIRVPGTIGNNLN